MNLTQPTPSLPGKLSDNDFRPATGFSLIENLIALLLLSICMLGSTLIQIKNTAESRNNLHRVLALDSIQSLHDILPLALSDLNNIDFTTLAQKSIPANTPAGHYLSGCHTGACSAVQLTQSLYLDWRQTLAKQLRNPHLGITTRPAAQTKTQKASGIQFHSAWLHAFAPDKLMQCQHIRTADKSALSECLTVNTILYTR